ncbi:MAG TPA: VWA domain-containing protein [Pyrinomonadaceae bacterium]|nr:VWA domain-containing protein [Pyrinomonadaceae bacterium]
MKFLIIAALCLAFTSTSYGQQSVSLSMIVTDNDNKGVNTIRKDQVRVIEDKIDQAILSIEPDERPVDLVIALDSSGSFRTLMPAALESARLMVVNRRPDDRIAIVRFVSRSIIEKMQEFTADGDTLLKAIDQFYVEKGQSAVIDALYISAQYVAEHNNSNDNRRRVVAIITDGEDRSSYYKEEQLLKLLREQGVQVFILGVVYELEADARFARPGSRAKAEKLLTHVAEESGGRVLFPKDKTALVESTAQVIYDLRAQFRIKYQSTNTDTKPGFRKVDVKFVSTDSEKRKLLAPPGYYFGPRPPATKPEKKP